MDRSNSGPLNYEFDKTEKSNFTGNFIIDKNINMGNYEPTSLLIPN